MSHNAYTTCICPSKDLCVVYQYMLVDVICRLTHMLFKILYAPFGHAFVPKRFTFSFEEFVARGANLHFAVSK